MTRVKHKCVVFDIDGVLLDTSFIIKEIDDKGLTGDEKWNYFYQNCNSNKVKCYETMKAYLKLLITQGILPILLTARNEHNREQTISKLKTEGIPFFKLYMRPVDNIDSSSEFKKEILIEIQKDYDILLFLDDDPFNVHAAELIGIPALKAPRVHLYYEKEESCK